MANFSHRWPETPKHLLSSFSCLHTYIHLLSAAKKHLRDAGFVHQHGTHPKCCLIKMNMIEKNILILCNLLGCTFSAVNSQKVKINRDRRIKKQSWWSVLLGFQFSNFRSSLRNTDIYIYKYTYNSNGSIYWPGLFCEKFLLTKILTKLR